MNYYQIDFYDCGTIVDHHYIQALDKNHATRIVKQDLQFMGKDWDFKIILLNA